MTEPSLEALDQPKPEEAPQRERSTIGFPYGDLDDGIEVTRALRELGDSAEHAQLAPKLGYSTVENGAYQQKLATARHFGLVNTSKEGVNLTPLGHRLADPTQASAARAEAFLNVPLYRAVYDQYKGYPLPPSNIGLEAVLVKLGVANKQKDKARQALQRSADQAGFFSQGRERLVAPAIFTTTPPPEEKPRDEDRGGKGGNGDGTKLPTLVQGLIEKLPLDKGSWSKDERDQWIKAAELIVDMVFKVEPLQIAGPQNTPQA